MNNRICCSIAASALLFAILGAAWDAPRTPARLVEFFAPGERYYLDTFADGYQAVKLDAATEEALRRTHKEADFASHVYSVVRRGDDFLHLRTATEETDVIVPLAALKRVSYRVERKFD